MMMGHDAIVQRIRSGLWGVYRDGALVAPEDLVIGTNSVDVTLGRKFIKTRETRAGRPIDPYDPASIQSYDVESDYIVLAPGDTILGHTRERFDLRGGGWNVGDAYFDIAPMYDGRSTCGRLFLASHITAGYGDVGFSSCWTLELKNMSECNALKLYAGMRIGQVSFHLVAGGISEKYHGAYAVQHDQPKAPVLGRDRF